jgi:hypothetical protein
MYAGLASAFEFAFLFGKGLEQDAERGLYADFLGEAATLLGQPGLDEAAAKYRAAAQLWRELPALLLPDEVAPLGETRALMQRKHRLFIEQGGASLAEIRDIYNRLAAIRRDMIAGFPLSNAEVTAHRERLAAHILRIRDAEQEAVTALASAIN